MGLTQKGIADLNWGLRGRASYFPRVNCKTPYRELVGWVGRRLRAKQLGLYVITELEIGLLRECPEITSARNQAPYWGP